MNSLNKKSFQEGRQLNGKKKEVITKKKEIIPQGCHHL
jgi:hypothetical protein